MIWGWQNFQKKYQILGNLKNVFSTILIYLLSSTVTQNILKYIRILPKLFPLLQIYRQLFNQPNLMYIISFICKIGFKDINFFILSKSAIGKISKAMIFVDKIKNAI